VHLYRNHVWKLHGLHNSIISDCRPQFAAAFMKELNKLLRITTKLSMAYHPQTDGQTERMNQEIEQYLCRGLYTPPCIPQESKQILSRLFFGCFTTQFCSPSPSQSKQNPSRIHNLLGLVLTDSRTLHLDYSPVKSEQSEHSKDSDCCYHNNNNKINVTTQNRTHNQYIT
jgi:hypothetical protein